MLRAQLPPVAALPIAELSTTGASAARAILLLFHDLFSCGTAVCVHDFDARVQLGCPAGRVLCVQLPPDSQA